MKRILFLTPSGERGGAEVVLKNILTHLDRKKFHPFVACFQDGPFVAELSKAAAVDVEIIPTGRFRELSARRRVIHQIEQMIQERGIDLVHCNGTGAHVYGSVAAQRQGVPSLFHVHDLLSPSWNSQGLIHWWAKRIPSTATVAVSDCVARALGSRINVKVIANGIEIPALARAKNGHQAPLVVWCGRLQRWKGAHIFLQAAAQIHRQIPSAQFQVVGGAFGKLDVGYEQKLHQMAHSLGLNGNLKFTGFQTDALAYLANADVVVHSSLRPEPFGLVVLEAMALGKPVVAAAEGGPAEIIEANVTGLLTPPANVEALAHAVTILLQDSGLRDRLGTAARERAQKDFSITKMMQAFEKLYGELKK